MSRTTTSLAAIARHRGTRPRRLLLGCHFLTGHHPPRPRPPQARPCLSRRNDGTVDINCRHPRGIPPTTTFEVLAQWTCRSSLPPRVIPSTITAYNGGGIADVGMRRPQPQFGRRRARPDHLRSALLKYDAQIRNWPPTSRSSTSSRARGGPSIRNSSARSRTSARSSASRTGQTAG